MNSSPLQVLRQLPARAASLFMARPLQGPPVLLHGLSATRRNVVQGSGPDPQGLLADRLRRPRRLLPAHATSTRTSWTTRAVLEELELERAALVGSSMGAATAMAFTLEHPERAGARADHPRLYRLRAHRRHRRRQLGAHGVRARGAAASMRSSRWRSPATCWRNGARSPARPPASAWSATSTHGRGLGAPRDPELDRLEGARAARPARRARADRRSRGTRPISCIRWAWPRNTPPSCPTPSSWSRTRVSSPLAWQVPVCRTPSRLLDCVEPPRPPTPPRPRAPVVEHRAEPHDRGPFLHGHLVVLRGPHREPLEPVLGRQPARRAKWRRLSSCRSVKGGIVISPVTGQGQRSM